VTVETDALGHVTRHTYDPANSDLLRTTYADGTSATIPIVYGQDVLDWWKYPGAADPKRGKVAWEGTNEAAKEFEATLRLYLTTWENPHPDKGVKAIDYSSTMDTPCAPFCVALTAEWR
jgi:hypothetical protein